MSINTVNTVNTAKSVNAFIGSSGDSPVSSGDFQRATAVVLGRNTVLIPTHSATTSSDRKVSASVRGFNAALSPGDIPISGGDRQRASAELIGINTVLPPTQRATTRSDCKVSTAVMGSNTFIGAGNSPISGDDHQRAFGVNGGNTAHPPP